MHFTKALITGASSGIGEALARLLAEQGIDLILTARDAQKLTTLSKELTAKVHVEWIAVDLSQAESRAKLVEEIHRQQPDLVVNNAGMGLYGEALSYDTASQQEMIDLNVTALTELTLEASRTLVSKSKPGVIMNISSAAAFQVMPCFAVYSATKAYINRFSEALDGELRKYDVRVLAACPGVVKTHFQQRAAVRAGGEPVPTAFKPMTAEFAANEIWQQIAKGIPLRIFDGRYRFLAFLSAHLPKKLVLWLLEKTFIKYLPKRDIIKTE